MFCKYFDCMRGLEPYAGDGIEVEIKKDYSAFTFEVALKIVITGS